MGFSYYENQATPPVVTTPADFSKYFNAGLGVTNPTANQTQEIIDWATQEGGNFHNTAFYNELNTTLPLPGSNVLSGGGAAAKAGVQAYGSTAQGLDAQLSTILEPRYANLVADIRNNVPETQFASDVAASPWGTGNWTVGVGGAGTGTGISTSSTPSSGSSGTETTGFDWNPLNWANDLGNDATSKTEKAILGVIETITAPLKSFIENGFLVVFGVIIIIIALVLAARGVASSGASSPSRPSGGGEATNGTTTFRGGGLAEAAAE